MRGLLWFACLIICAPALAADALPALGTDLDDSSVSGLSSGAFMAVQFQLAHSSIVRGAGVFAGGLWGCARGDTGRATGECAQGSPEAGPFVAAARAAAAKRRIDPLSDLEHSRVWLFSGYNDGVVRQSATDALRAFYTDLIPPGQVFYRNDLNAGHALVTLDHGPACNTTGGDFIDDCDYDAVGAMLQFIYGRLEPPGAALDGNLRKFDQREFAPGGTRAAALDDDGYLYVPKACADGVRCRVHVALHGCRQGAETVGDAFYRFAGYNRWAENNRIVVLYPQARATWGVPLNPYGCWDWWGYSGPDYTSKGAPQIAALRAMVDRLSVRPRAATPVAAVPAAPAVVDASASALAVAWRPMPNAIDYEIEVAGRVLRVQAPAASLAIDALAPATLYAVIWRARGTQGHVLAEIRLQGTTAARPRACDPWYAHNVAHVAAGRAYVLWGLTYALGTGQAMSWWNIFTTTALHRVPSGFAVGPCP
ncbi:MAG: PHB depolymerase family esterase [Betaproteobacteria bacterium]